MGISCDAVYSLKVWAAQLGGVEGFQPPAVVELAATGAPEVEPPVSE